MKNADYWINRMRLLEEALHDRSLDYFANLARQFDIAIKDLEKDIRAWYQRFSNNNGGVSWADAQRLLNSNELKEFKWDVWEYIEKCKESAINGAWVKQLENASARVHISRLESLKIQLQQQAEMLTQKSIKATADVSELSYTESYYHTAFEIQRGIGVGWTMQGVNKTLIEKVLSRPWTSDNRTFTARCWTDKAKLVETLNQELTRMVATGDAPDRAIKAIAKRFNVSKSNAGRVVMTESAHFAETARRDCFDELGVERYQIDAALDVLTCDTCGDMDGKVFKMSEYSPGTTAPLFHPRCRCTIVPYEEDMEGLGERFARDVKTGKGYRVPNNTTYKQWKEMQDAKYGAGTVDKERKKWANQTADKEQLKRYRSLLGNEAPRSLADFQTLKYDTPDSYAALKVKYADKGIQKRIRNNTAYTTLKTGQQGKHIIGNNNYTEGRSYLTGNMDDAQKLIKKYAGKGEIRRDSKGKWTHKEFCTADKIIGYYAPPDGSEPIPTNRFSISYATGKDKGAHIVPAKPEKEE